MGTKVGKGRSLLREFRTVFFLLAFAALLRSSVFGLYVVPTGSMLPTIRIDDRVFSNKLAYGLSLPFMEKALFRWSEPQRGQIILFRSPVEGGTYVKRVAGIAGDRLTFVNGVLHVNDEPVKETPRADPGLLRDTGQPLEAGLLLFEESLGVGKHDILRQAEDGATAQEERKFVVPEGQLFCLGDNRDGSEDSRTWGFVPVDEVYGEALFVLFSTRRSSSPLPKFRTDRFFARLR